MQKKKEIIFHPGTYSFPIPFLLNTYNIGICHAEITINDAYDTTIVVSQDDINKGGITNYFEQIATNIQKLFFNRLGVVPNAVKWVELYPAGVVEFDELCRAVKMQWDEENRVYHSPKWGHLELENRKGVGSEISFETT